MEAWEGQGTGVYDGSMVREHEDGSIGMRAILLLSIFKNKSQHMIHFYIGMEAWEGQEMGLCDGSMVQEHEDESVGMQAIVFYMVYWHGSMGRAVIIVY